MFGNSDQVDVGTFVCPNCKRQIFFLYDAGGNGVVMKIHLRCAGCSTVLERTVLPGLTERDADPNLQGPAQAAANQLWCDATGTNAPPDGVCRGLQFRVLERGNELLSKCTRCGHGDTLGMINPAVG